MPWTTQPHAIGIKENEKNSASQKHNCSRIQTVQVPMWHEYSQFAQATNNQFYLLIANFSQ